MSGGITVTQTGCSTLQLALPQQLCHLHPLDLVERETGITFSQSSLSNSIPAHHFLPPQHLIPCAKSLYIPCPYISGARTRWKLSILFLLPVRQAGRGAMFVLRDKNQGLKFFLFPVVCPATNIIIVSAQKKWYWGMMVSNEQILFYHTL